VDLCVLVLVAKVCRPQEIRHTSMADSDDGDEVSKKRDYNAWCEM
jgi:hypothetical protein